MSQRSPEFHLSEREASLFDLSITKILILAVLGLMIFGPEQLPRMAAQAGKALRDLRRMAENAKSDLTDSLGPDFKDFDFNDLNPKSFVRKHLIDGFDDDDDLNWSGPERRGGHGHRLAQSRPDRTRDRWRPRRHHARRPGTRRPAV